MALKDYLSLVIRKPVFALWEQQRRRSACTSAQSDQHLCCSLLRQYNICSCYVLNFKTIASLCGCAGRFESYLVANYEDRFSRDEVHFFSFEPSQSLLFVWFVVLRPSQQLWSCWDGQLTEPHYFWASFLSSSPILSAHSFASNWQLSYFKQQ